MGLEYAKALQDVELMTLLETQKYFQLAQSQKPTSFHANYCFEVDWSTSPTDNDFKALRVYQLVQVKAPELCPEIQEAICLSRYHHQSNLSSDKAILLELLTLSLKFSSQDSW